MTDTSQAEIPPQTNGISDMDDDERAKMRPVDIDADVREMERRKRVELIMNSKLFREELERIIETQLKDGSGPSGLLQQISDMVGVNKQAGNVFKSSSCVIPINDIRGIEAMGYAKGEKILRCKLACLYRLIDLYGWAHGSNTLITARLNQDEEQFLINPYGMLFHELTASSLIKVDMQGGVIEQGTTNFPVNIAAFSLHAAVHSARPDIKCIIHIHTPSVVAVSALKHGLLPLSQESVVIGEVSTHTYLGGLLDPEEKDKLARNLGPNNKVLLLSNLGALCCGETIEEAFYNARNTVLASESQLKLLPIGIDNLVLITDETRKRIYDVAHKPPESTPRPDQPSILEGKVERKWRVGGTEFESLMRMLDNAGFRTGYIYRHPLVKGEPPRPKNDVEVPPAVSSLGYLLEEEELYRQGLWRKLEGGRKGNDRSRWLNSPNTYQKVEILETGTPDPKKITKWVAEASPSHSSTPVKIESALQFVPKGTNPREFKQKQQQIKENRRADKISAGPQSHILEGVTWEEAKKMQDATVTQTGDHVVLMGAASKGIIQRGHQHNAMVYKSPYAKNPFDSITDEELEDYKKVVEKKSKGDFTDTDYSESEGLSSAPLHKRIDGVHIRSPTSVTSETEEESRDEPQILRIETKTAPRPSQPEVVLSDVETSPIENFLKAERVSVNSYKNYKTRDVSCYRTYSHAGFPKGSYSIPNPTHFHIARQTQIAVRKPRLVTIAPHNISSQYLFNHNRTPTITLNIGHAHSVSVNIPFETLTGFIFPIASALNYRNITVSNSQSCQTSYMNNFEYVPPNNNELNKVNITPLYVDSYNTCQWEEEPLEKTNLFEERVLNNLRQNILTTDFTSDSERELSNVSETFVQNTDDVDICEFIDNSQLMNDNEGLIELTPEVIALLPTSSSSSSSTDNKDITEIRLDNNHNSPEPELKNSNNKRAFKIVEEFIDAILEDCEKIALIEDAVNEVKDYSKEIFNNFSESVSIHNTTDEGIEDCTIINETTFKDSVLNVTVEEGVGKLSKLILGYLIQQCYELKELILFPELLHEPNLIKLLSHLKDVFDEYYENSLTNDQRNSLRISIASHTLTLLELEDQLNNSEESIASNIVSDKVFSISEFLNDILDHFFNILEKDNGFENFSESLIDKENKIVHSTPEQENKSHDFSKSSNTYLDKLSTDTFAISMEDETSNTELEELEITSFQKGANKRSGSELYWIAVTNSPVPKKVKTPNKPIISIDDIPLKPPEYFNPQQRILSPIMEEPRINLFDSVLSDDSDIFTDASVNTPLNESTSSEEDFLKIDSLLTEECNKLNSYVSFNNPDNIILNNTVNFCRTSTVNESAFVQTRNAVFKPFMFENKENDPPSDDSGNWMGYESAKF